jgi:hypothetical protein
MVLDLFNANELWMHLVLAGGVPVRAQLVCSAAGYQAYVLRFVLGKRLLPVGTRAVLLQCSCAGACLLVLLDMFVLVASWLDRAGGGGGGGKPVGVA